MNEKFKKFTGGMKLSVFLLAAVVIFTIYTVASDASDWVKAGFILAAAVIVILFIRITRIGRGS